MDPHELPVYRQKEKILEALAHNQVIVVESPTGSGKTTQLPIILHEAGFARYGIIGVTQPRRIAVLSVSDFLARQLGVSMPGTVGYKMRFEDRTDSSTAIKIMTDGILLQEMKLDPLLSRYGVLMVDEAHERSLNIDFILGLLKHVLEERPEFKVIVSSATINAEVFSEYFGECPVVKIETETWPVTVIYDSPAAEDESEPVYRASDEALLDKISSILERVMSQRMEGEDGDVLIFLPGEKAIKECMKRLAYGPLYPKLHLVPLYSRLGKDEQERVFDKAPEGKTKIVMATNIAETSVTIDGIAVVIDSGLAKLNYYNPRTFTSSLIETPISKASCNQRKGRAGRTRPGACYRLYPRKDFENRPLFTTEEIYRTDLSEVVLRMAELGISDFDRFEFISRPAKSGIAGAVDSLNLLDALTPERTLSKVGEMMCAFPLLPRLSRMIVESILRYPDVVDETLIAASFLSTMSPYILPPGEEMEARRAHHAFRDPQGDFVSYLRIFKSFVEARDKTRFCEHNYLDERTLHEIVRIREQLGLIVSGMGIPISGGGESYDYLCAVSRGLIQFVCARQDRGLFRSLTAEKIQIHPGSVMFRENPDYIVAGEIVRTTRMYAMSVSPLPRELLSRISPRLVDGLGKPGGSSGGTRFAEGSAGRPGTRSGDGHRGRERVHGGQTDRGSAAGSRDRRHESSFGAGNDGKQENIDRDFTKTIEIGGRIFPIERDKGSRKTVILDWNEFRPARDSLDKDISGAFKGLKAVLRVGSWELMRGEKLETVLRIASWLDPENDMAKDWPHGKNFRASEKIPADGIGQAVDPGASAIPAAPAISATSAIKDAGNLSELVHNLNHVLQAAKIKGKGRSLGFIALYSGGNGEYWFKVTKGFHTALNESLASLENLADAMGSGSGDPTAGTDAERELVGSLYRRLSSFFD